jgi:hypothetical protein
MNNSIKIFAFATFSLLSACSADDKTSPLVIPAAYSAATFQANTTTEYNLRNNFRIFVAELQKGRTAGVALDANTLRALYEKDNPSISSITLASTRANMNLIFAEIDKASKGTTYQFGKSPAENGNGGTNNGYLYDETGLELEQILDKGSFGAAFYNQATILSANPTATNLDKMLALFGSNPTFPNTPTAAKTPQPDVIMANYAARRTKGTDTSKGLYFQMQSSFIKAQAAILAGEKYNKDRDEAVAAILLTWEKINAATVINYLFDVETKLSSVAIDDKLRSSAMHAYGECVGFLTGFRGIAKKKITDAQIEDALLKMNATAPYKIMGSPSEIAKLVQVRSNLQAIYGFSNTEMEEFKQNWVNVEGR